jgi:hypothetical protein
MRRKRIKTVVLFVFLLVYTLTAISEQVQPATKKIKKETIVYICDSKNSYAYHASKTCMGISKCRHQLIALTKADAVTKYHRKACRVCY